MASNRVFGGTVELEGENQYRQALKNINSDLRTLSASMVQITQEFKSNGDSVDANAKKQKTLETQLERQKEKVELLKQTLAQSAEQYGENDSRTNNWRTALTRAETEVMKTEQSLKELNNTSKVTNEDIKFMNDTFSSFGKTVAKDVVKGLEAVGVALAGVLAYSTKVGASFESEMSKVSAVSGATGEDFDALKAKAEEMGEKTKFSATESAQALYYMGLAGWDSKQMLSGLDGVMNLASASGEDLATVSDIVTDALTAMGYSADKASEFSDVLASASSNSNTTVALMGETFKYVGTEAGALGYSMQDLALATGLMANSGIKGSIAGTSLNTVLTRLATNTKGSQDAIKELGIEFYNSDGTARDLSDVLDELRNATAKLTVEEKSNLAKKIAGVEAQKGLLAILNASKTDYDKLSTAINNSSGASQKMADTMNDNVSGAFTIMKSSLEAVGISIYDDFADPLKESLQSGTKSINALNTELNKPAMKKSIQDLAKNVGNLVETVIDFGTDALPVAVGGLNLLLGNMDKIIPVVGTATGAYVAYNVAVGLCATTTEGLTGIQALAKSAQIAYTLVTQSGTVATEGATVAQLGLNSAVLANPYAIAGIALAGLVAGITALVIVSGNSKSAIQEETDAINESIEAREQARIASEEQMNSELSHMGYIQNLKNELDNLVDANGKVKEGYEERASFILGELNSALGTEYKLTDLQVGKYKELSDAINKSILQKRAEIVLKAQEEAYTEAVTNLAQARIDAKKAEDEYNEKSVSLKESIVELTKQLEGDLTESERALIANRISEQRNELKELEENRDAKAKNLKDYNDTITKYETDSLLMSKGTAEAYEAIMQGTADVTAETSEDKVASIKAQKDKTEEYISELNEKIQSETNESRKKTLEQLRDSQQENVKSLDSQMKALTKTTDTGLSDVNNVTKDKMFKFSATMKNESLVALTAFKGDTQQYFGIAQDKYDEMIKGLKSKDPEVKKKAEDTASQLYKKLSSKNDEYSKTGANMLAGINQGISSGNARNSLFNSMSNLGLNLLSNFKKSLGIKSPSREFAKLSQYIPQGIEKGIDDNENIALSSIRNLSKDMTNEFDKIPTTYDLGVNTSRTNTIDTISSMNSSSLYNQITSVVNDTVNEALKRIDDNIDAISKKPTYLIMDSGALVGEIKDDVDSALGDNQILKRRNI